MASWKAEKIKIVFEKLNYGLKSRPQEISAQGYLELYNLLFS
jgi:hypothetical protein